MPKANKPARKTASQQKPANTRAAPTKFSSRRDGTRPSTKETKPKTRSKSETVLDLLRKPNGASLPELAKATGWQNHSVRGFLSGTVKKRMGLTVTSTRADKAERRYKLERP
jgi:hypothetical protein